MAESSFERDDAKDRVTQAKHGVSFGAAQHAFLDPKRVIVPDLGHSGVERRYFCFGAVEGGVMTVRFTWRAGRVRIIGAGYGAKAERSMSRKAVKYTQGEIGKVGPVLKDFLPPPDQLVLREANVKVTLSLSRRSVDFFKRESKRQRVPYQRMIRALVDAYAEKEGL